jgi:hypothetical protein
MDIGVWEDRTAFIFIINPEDGGRTLLWNILSTFKTTRSNGEDNNLNMYDSISGQCEAKNLEAQYVFIEVWEELNRRMVDHRVMNRTVIKVV